MNIIPIVILTRNEKDNLKKTIDSIVKNTKSQYVIYIVDNNSDCINHLAYLNTISSKYKIFYSKSNKWILSLNNCLADIGKCKNYHKDYVVISDGDIEIPDDLTCCWLDKMKGLMDKNIFLGKLGVSLDLKNIKDSEYLQKTYIREKYFYEKKLCEGVYSAPVDTTLAIYRKDIFIDDLFLFYPGHMSYIKPYYHVGRSSDVRCVHLGWNNYKKQENKTNLHEKIKCFALCGAYIDPENLKFSDKKYFLFYKIIHPLSKAYWGVRLYYKWIVYIIKNKLIRLNKIYK